MSEQILGTLGNQERLMRIILGPHISEKATRIAEKQRQIAFKVVPDATKLEIKKAVEQLFQVKVQTVTTCNVKGKVRHFKQTIGRCKSWKKAHVSLVEGYDINFTGMK
jgi:large subunit ribosomal protein L23